MNTSPLGLTDPVELARAGGEVRNVMDDHRQEREVELRGGSGDRIRGAVAVDDSRMRAAALGLGAHLRRGLDADDARLECVREHRREAARTGAEVENRQVRARNAEVAGNRLHPEPAGVAGEGTAGAIRAIETLVVVDACHQSASGSGNPLNASVGIGAGGVISRRSHRA
jgi:hypothetical protein